MTTSMITRLPLSTGGKISHSFPVGSRAFAVRVDTASIHPKPELLVLWATDSFEYVTKYFVTAPDKGHIQACPSMLSLVGSYFDAVGIEQFVFEVA